MLISDWLMEVQNQQEDTNFVVLVWYATSYYDIYSQTYASICLCLFIYLIFYYIGMEGSISNSQSCARNRLKLGKHLDERISILNKFF